MPAELIRVHTVLKSSKTLQQVCNQRFACLWRLVHLLQPQLAELAGSAVKLRTLTSAAVITFDVSGCKFG